MDDKIREAFDKTDHDADYYYAFKSGYASRNQEVEKLKEQIKRMKTDLRKIADKDAVYDKIYTLLNKWEDKS